MQVGNCVTVTELEQPARAGLGNALIRHARTTGTDFSIQVEVRFHDQMPRSSRSRVRFVRESITLQFKGNDLEMRTMLFVCYHTWESPMFREISRKRRRELIDARVELLTRP